MTILPKIMHPVFVVTVPSTKETVKMRQMLVKEEKILLMAREGEDRQEILTAIKQVVNNCLETKVDIDNLTLFDVEYLFLRLRAQSVSPETKVSYIDNDDGKTYTFDVDLNEVVVKFPENAEKEIKASDMVTIVMRYPPASLYSDKEFLSSEGEKLVDMLIQRSIDTIYDGKNVIDVASSASKMTATDLQKWIEELDIKTYNKIRDFLNNLPSLFYEIKYTNANGKERVITLATLNDFFTLA